MTLERPPNATVIQLISALERDVLLPAPNLANHFPLSPLSVSIPKFVPRRFSSRSILACFIRRLVRGTLRPSFA